MEQMKIQQSLFLNFRIVKMQRNSQMGRNYTPWKYKAGQAFGWFSMFQLMYMIIILLIIPLT